jgi:hypothetical protein
LASIAASTDASTEFRPASRPGAADDPDVPLPAADDPEAPLDIADVPDPALDIADVPDPALDVADVPDPALTGSEKPDPVAAPDLVPTPLDGDDPPELVPPAEPVLDAVVEPLPFSPPPPLPDEHPSAAIADIAAKKAHNERLRPRMDKVII